MVSLLPVPPACPLLSHRFAFVPLVPATWDALSFLLHLSEASPSFKAILNVPFSKSLCRHPQLAVACPPEHHRIYLEPPSWHLLSSV